MNFIVLALIALPVVLGTGGCSREANPEGAADGEVALDVLLPRYGNVRFVSVGDFENRSRVEYLLQDRQGKTIYSFPEFPANREYAYHQTRSAKFADINGDGLDDVVVIAQYMTGIGPSGAEPFDVAGFFMQRESGFDVASELTGLVNGEKYYGKWHGIEDLIEIAHTHTGGSRGAGTAAREVPSDN